MKDGQIIISESTEMSVPIEQVARVIIAKPSVMISAALLVELSSRHISVLMCDDRYMPACEVTGMGLHNESAGLLMDQINWEQEQKDAAWSVIVNAKIKMQARLLNRLGLKPSTDLTVYINGVQPGDPTNREAMAARVYFSALFGKGFHRNAGGNINSALNYGYAILLSAFSRIVAMHGYHNGLGIHHCKRDNRFNLACDLMEPFRPFVDAAVWKHGDCELDWPYKKELISLPHGLCRYGGRRMDLDTAMEGYALDVMKMMIRGTDGVGEIEFAE